MSQEPALYPDLNQPLYQQYQNPSPSHNFDNRNTPLSNPVNLLPQFAGRPHSIVPGYTDYAPGAHQFGQIPSSSGHTLPNFHSPSQCMTHQKPINLICKASSCTQRLLCETCKSEHISKHPKHAESIRSALEVFDPSVLDELNQLSKEENPTSEPSDPRYKPISKLIRKGFDELRARGEELLNQAEDQAQERVKEFFLLKKDASGWSDVRNDYLRKRDLFLSTGAKAQNKELEDFLKVLEDVQQKKIQREAEIEENLNQGRDQMDKFIQRFKDSLALLTDTLFTEKEDSQKSPISIDPTKVFYNKEVKGDHKFILNAMTYIPKVDQLITASECGTLTAWNPLTYAPITTYKVHSNAINTLLYVEKENLLITGSKDKTIRVLPVDANGINISKPEVFTSHTAPVRSLLLLEGEDRFASAGEDADLRIWHLKTRNLDTIISTKGWKTCGDEMAFIRPERWIAVAGRKEIRIYDYVTRDLLIKQSAMKTTGSLSFMSEKRLLSVQEDKNTIALWKLDSEKKRLKRESRLKLPANASKSVYFKCFEESDLLLASTGSNKVVIFDLANGKVTKEIETKLQNPTSFTLLKNDRKVAIGDAGSNLVGFLHY